MQFHEMNKNWLLALGQRHDLIEASGAVQATKHYLASQGAAGEPYLAIPLVMDQQQFDEVAEAGRLLLRAQGKILGSLSARHGREELCKLFEVSEAIRAFIDWDNLVSGHNLIVRFDVVPTTDGYRFCEINCDSTVAGFELFECQKIYADTLGWSLVAKQHSPHGDICRLFQRLTQTNGAKRVLVAVWSRSRDTSWFAFDFLKDALKQALPDLDVRMAYEDDYPKDWLQPDAG